MNELGSGPQDDAQPWLGNGTGVGSGSPGGGNNRRGQQYPFTYQGAAAGTDLASKAWFWFRHGPVQALMAIGILIGLSVTVHIAFDEHASADLYNAAKPCTAEQFAAMTGPTRWCVLSGVTSYQYFPQPDDDNASGFFVDLPMTVTEVLSASNGGSSGAADSILVRLDPDAALLSELGSGDQVTVVATVRQSFGSATGVAGSVDYQGVTAQTWDSPTSILADDTEFSLLLAAAALFFAVWAVRSWFAWETAAWSGAMGGALGLFLGLWAAEQEQWSASGAYTSAFMSILYAGLPGALVGAVAFTWVSLARGGLDNWWGLAGPDPTAGNGSLLWAALLLNHRPPERETRRAGARKDRGRFDDQGMFSTGLVASVDRPWKRTRPGAGALNRNRRR